MKKYYVDIEFMAPLDLWGVRTGTIPVDAESEEEARAKILGNLKTVRDPRILSVSESPPEHFHDTDGEPLPSTEDPTDKKLH